MKFAAPIIGGLIGTSSALLLHYQFNKNKVKQTGSPNSSFEKVEVPQEPNPNIIHDHIEQKYQNYKFIIYSKLHKQPLSIHSLLTFADQNYSLVDNTLPQQQAVSQFFHKYAQNLLKSKKCLTVQLIQGPIFSKQSKYKTKDAQTGKQTISTQIFKNHVYIDQQGMYKTKHFYEIVICNQQNRHYINGFTLYKDPLHPTLNLVSKTASLLQIQERTGLSFKVEGDPLTQIDFDQMNKERDWEYNEIKKEVKE